MYKVIVSFLLVSSTLFSQNKNQPKLIVGIVIDQMRYDMLTRFEKNYSEGGFKRLMHRGFFAENMHFNYAPTYTGPGHASIYTGTTPAIHGIAANDWVHNGLYAMYCTQDDSAISIGVDSKSGKMSPKNLKVTTMTDQLRLFTSNKSKVIGIAIKDRGAILPAGNMANAAYWYDGKSGNWITSSWYMKSLPQWLTEFNYKKHYKRLMADNWTPLLPINKYIHLTQDSVNWEEDNFKKGVTTLPYTFNEEKNATQIRLTPFGNNFTTELAIEIMKKEEMGKGSATDFLAVSYSSTDYIGHAYGPYSMETEDCYYRLDLEMKKLLETLDSTQGKDNYWVFLTADHGVQDVPDFSRANKMHGGNVTDKELMKLVNDFLVLKTGKQNLIKEISNDQITLNKDEVAKSNLDAEKIAKLLQSMDPTNMKGINGFYAFTNMSSAPLPISIREQLINGYCPNRSGDIAILLEPNWMNHGSKGTSHGSIYSHDTHVPFIFYGKGVLPKTTAKQYNITDIAPTITYLLGTLQPNGCTGLPILELEYLRK
jgi:predicted AlkP superfamily pyrophosphatase or phosphodiesterase